MLRRLFLSGVLMCSVGLNVQPASALDGVSPTRRSLAPPPVHRFTTSPAVVYRYDSLGRLVRDQRTGATLTYTYDGAGNRVQSTVQH